METQKQLSVADIAGLIEQVKNNLSDPVTTALSIFGRLDSNVTLAGEVLGQAFTQAGIKPNELTADIISHIRSVSKNGDDVTITNDSNYSVKQGGKTIDIAGAVSFRVGQQNNLPAISGVKGLIAHFGILKATLERLQIVVKDTQKVLQVTGNAFGGSHTIDVPLSTPKTGI